MRTLSTVLLLSLLSNNPLTYANTHKHVMKQERPNQNTIQLVIKNASTKITANTTKTIRLEL